jgi:CheY-like chemotaxis protein
MQRVVLLVDDNRAARYVLSRTLRVEGFDVWEAGDGTEALRRAGDGPDVILLDVKLPDINGFEVCRRLKDEPGSSQIPVIHMSASYYQEEDRQRGLAAGAIAYITGFDVQTVVKTIRDVLGHLER